MDTEAVPAGAPPGEAEERRPRADHHRASLNSGSIPVDWEGLARATSHPLRIAILVLLGLDGGRVMSPNELSFELQLPLSNTNYHVKALAEDGLIELVRERGVRGATEHFYGLRR